MNQIILSVPAIDTQPSWCQTHNCKCPCHAEPTPWYIPVAGIGVVLAALTAILWFAITATAWLFPLDDSRPTLVRILSQQWDWLKDLAGRIY